MIVSLITMAVSMTMATQDAHLDDVEQKSCYCHNEHDTSEYFWISIESLGSFYE